MASYAEFPARPVTDPRDTRLLCFFFGGLYLLLHVTTILLITTAIVERPRGAHAGDLVCDRAARQTRSADLRGLSAYTRRRHQAPAGRAARIIDASGEAVGRHTRAAGDRHIGQRAHPDRNGIFATTHRRDRCR